MDYLQQIQKTSMVLQKRDQAQTPQNPELKQIMQFMQDQKNHVERVLKLNMQKVYSLEKEVNDLRLELGKAQEVIAKISDKEVVRRSREALFNRQDKDPVDRPIDRNGVCPKDVQISKIFNFSGKRF